MVSWIDPDIDYEETSVSLKDQITSDISMGMTNTSHVLFYCVVASADIAKKFFDCRCICQTHFKRNDNASDCSIW